MLLRILLISAFLSFPAGLAAAEAVEAGNERSFTEAPDDFAELDRLHLEAERCLLLNDFDGALEAFGEAVLLEPDDDGAYAHMGHIYLVKGDPGRARNAFEQALDIDPENEMARAGMARLRDPDAII